jgi:hypothetical protein
MNSREKGEKTRRKFIVEITGAAVCGVCLKWKAFAGPAPNQGRRAGTESLVAVCGLYCGACPMYLATRSDDEEKRQALLKRFSAGPSKLTMEDILCDGCLGTGRVASFCRSCAIRACPSDKSNVARCSDCPDFPCARIAAFNNDGMLHHAEVLDNLRQMQKLGLEKWARYEAERWSCPRCGLPMSWYDAACSGCGEARSERLFKLAQR